MYGYQNATGISAISSLTCFILQVLKNKWTCGVGRHAFGMSVSLGKRKKYADNVIHEILVCARSQ